MLCAQLVARGALSDYDVVARGSCFLLLCVVRRDARTVMLFQVV